MRPTAKTKKYVLLDRDGTIIVNRHYQKDPALTLLLPNAREGLDALRRAGFGLVVVTNQSGIGRGLLTREDLAAVNRSMVDLLGDGVFFDGIYFCPHVAEDGCRCRKPRPGMAEEAAADLGFDPAQSIVVGDSERDVEMGKQVGAATVLVRTGYGKDVEGGGGVTPDYVADDLLDAAKWIIRRHGF